MYIYSSYFLSQTKKSPGLAFWLTPANEMSSRALIFGEKSDGSFGGCRINSSGALLVDSSEPHGQAWTTHTFSHVLTSAESTAKSVPMAECAGVLVQIELNGASPLAGGVRCICRYQVSAGVSDLDLAPEFRVPSNGAGTVSLRFGPLPPGVFVLTQYGTGVSSSVRAIGTISYLA